MMAAIEIRVRGRVQGVGFRPAVWRLARECDLAGEVLNDSEGVLVRVSGRQGAINAFLGRLAAEAPPLARIEHIETRAFTGILQRGFRIAATAGGTAHTEITPDIALCQNCAAEITAASGHRRGYPFTSCTQCGPRFSIVTALPFDRANTTMAAFDLCPSCHAEYRDPADRRFHAEAIACPACGPHVRLIRLADGAPALPAGNDAITAAAGLLREGDILAIKGLGGYQLAADATNGEAVLRLRALKRRGRKPFALMARDLATIGRYCVLSETAATSLQSPAAPILLLAADGTDRLPESVAPGFATLGFMLPTTPMHALLLAALPGPLVMTSGNIAGEPLIIEDAAARAKLAGIARHALVHDRAITTRIDDSVVRIAGGRPRLIRRARGYAPAPLPLPPGFERALPVLAFGGDLKASFCLVKDGAAILSQHIGDLEDASTFDAYGEMQSQYARLFDHAPRALAADLHPDYFSAKLARARAAATRLPLIEVQHHHAHLAACLAENRHPLGAPPVLGIVLDGLGWGQDGTIWGGEFLLGDYRGFKRLACLKPVAMPGGAQAAREPWRNLHAHLAAAIGWARFDTEFAGLELHRMLADKPRAALDAMLHAGINSPLASSCGRLFDAIAAALGLRPGRQDYEGEAAARLETITCPTPDEIAYPFALVVPEAGGPIHLDPAPMWEKLLADLARDVPPGVIAARFHQGLAGALAGLARQLAQGVPGASQRFDTVALSGGCFQNRILFELLTARLAQDGFTVLSHAEIPAGDGGLALGQAVVAAATLSGAPDFPGANTLCA
jgi:hydrogenase maturation protein HypF